MRRYQPYDRQIDIYKLDVLSFIDHRVSSMYIPDVVVHPWMSS